VIPKILTFIDVETTGTSPNYDRIIEIGMVRVVAGKVENTYQSLVNPQMYLPTDITNITGITGDHLENAPTFRQIKDNIDEMTADSVVVAHNARFDTAFLKSEYQRLRVKFDNRYFCTAKLSRLLFPRFSHHNLDSIIQRFDLKCEPRHRAFADTMVLWDFFQILKKQNEDKLVKAVGKLLRRPALPPSVSEKMIDKLEDKPGVYIFYSGETPLYIGKSVNVRTRVLSHFYSDQKNSREFLISQQVNHIESKPTAGELEALLLEKRLISQMQPTYNRQLRNMRDMAVCIAKKIKSGYDTIELKITSKIEVKEIPLILAVYRSQGKGKRALIELAKEYSLCQKLLGLEKGRGRCFGSQIEQCKGACINEENPIKYNMRFAESFANTKIRQWPFPGAIIVTEGDKGHLIYKWCYLGLISDNEDLAERKLSEPQFDYDTYKILVKHLLNPKINPRIRNYRSLN